MNLNLVKRPWGTFQVIDMGPGFVVKRIEVQPGQKLSLQSHAQRKEYWNVVSGRAEVYLDGREFFLSMGKSIFINNTIKHRLSNPENHLLIIIEIQMGNCQESDIVRYSDLYGRC